MSLPLEIDWSGIREKSFEFLLLWNPTVCIHNFHYESFQTCITQRIINICDLTHVGQMLTFAVFYIGILFILKSRYTVETYFITFPDPLSSSLSQNHSPEAKMSLHIHIFKYMYYIGLIIHLFK